MVSDLKEAYTELLEVLEKHVSLLSGDYKIPTANDMRNRLKAIELNEKYNLDIKPSEFDNPEYYRFSDTRYISSYGEDYGRTIGWPDDGRQPNNEMLYVLRYSTGAYIFGQDYPADFFKEFWNKLLTYNPKYKDTRNSSLYFSMDDAAKIHNDHDSIYKSFSERAKDDYKRRKLEKLKKEVAALENDND